MNGTLLREIPGDSVVHRLWAGTKLVSVAVVGVSLVVRPSWAMLVAVSALLLTAAAAARIGPGAVPRPPWWLWAMIVFGGLVQSIVGLDAVGIYLRGLLFGVVLLWASTTVAWTTPPAEIAPSISTLLGPLRRIRVPVDDIAASLALCLRALPLLVDEIYTLFAARRLRPSGVAGGIDSILVDGLTAIMAAAIRRSSEMGDAIEVRGGSGRITKDLRRPARADGIAVVAVVAACTAGFLL